MSNVFSGFAVFGAYSRYKVNLNPNLDPWDNDAARRVALQAGTDRTRHSRPILYACGMSDTAFDLDGPDGIPGWNSNPAVPTRALQTLQDLTIRNGCSSVAPGYTPSAAKLFQGQIREIQRSIGGLMQEHIVFRKRLTTFLSDSSRIEASIQ
jgi:hypothetical protein